MSRPQYAKIAVPLLEKIHRENYITGKLRFAAYFISEERWEELEAAAKKDDPLVGLQSKVLAEFGYLNLYYKGIPVLSNTELSGNQVVGLDRDLVRGLHQMLRLANEDESFGRRLDE
jgi:hypothetical protein